MALLGLQFHLLAKFVNLDFTDNKVVAFDALKVWFPFTKDNQSVTNAEMIVEPILGITLA